jgi:hypothetical protein
VAQVVKHLPSKCEAPSSKPIAPKNEEKEIIPPYTHTHTLKHKDLKLMNFNTTNS